jgi:gas vesicle protein
MMDRDEDQDHQAHSVTFVSGFLLGAMVGAGIALLAAPEAGNRTRRKIRRVAGDLKESAGDQWDDLAEEVKDRVDDALQGARKRFLGKREG